jgi:hypothetical protein
MAKAHAGKDWGAAAAAGMWICGLGGFRVAVFAISEPGIAAFWDR